jgi:hypothetical protein
MRAAVPVAVVTVIAAAVASACGSGAPAGPPSAPAPRRAGRAYPWHTGIVATTFWVGEVFDPASPDGSQVTSTYDSRWMERYGGCDGVVVGGTCATEPRTAATGFRPTRMTPRQNPFYLDLPFDDLNDERAFARRSRVVPWAADAGYAGHATDRSFSYLKNRWVRLRHAGRTCYGQVEDAGPGRYDDDAYVFGHDDPRPANRRYNGAGLDVSPALNSCLDFSQLNGDGDRVDWQFAGDTGVPPGPWTWRVTRDGVIT